MTVIPEREYLLILRPQVDKIFPYGNIFVISTAKLGELIRQRRKMLGVTQRALALTSGTGLRFIIDLENGKETCQIGKVLTVLHTLGFKLSLTAPTPRQQGAGNGSNA
jgi:y4mF family transcriptional regulator